MRLSQLEALVRSIRELEGERDPVIAVDIGGSNYRTLEANMKRVYDHRVFDGLKTNDGLCGGDYLFDLVEIPSRP